MFDLTIAKNSLLPCLLMVAGAVDKKQSLAILSNLLLEINADKLILTATDLEIEISATLFCDNNSTSSKITVPAKKLIDIIRSLDDGTFASIKSKDNLIIIKANRSQFKLSTLPAEKFPATTPEQADIELTLPRLDLIRIFQSTFFAMSQQDVRFYLNGLLLEFNGQYLTTVATDGHRMAICKIPCVIAANHQRYLIPRKSAQEIIKLLNTISDETVDISMGKNFFRLTSSDYCFTSKLIEAKFPPYNKAVPLDNDKFVLVDKESLKRALNRIIILAHEKSRAVLMHIQANELTLVANNQEQEEAVESLEAHVEGTDLKIGINATYLLDVLQVLPDDLIRLSMSSMDRSILIESVQNEDYQYIIMPMKL